MTAQNNERLGVASAKMVEKYYPNHVFPHLKSIYIDMLNSENK